jgi:hypothetical protein
MLTNFSAMLIGVGSIPSRDYIEQLYELSS